MREITSGEQIYDLRRAQQRLEFDYEVDKSSYIRNKILRALNAISSEITRLDKKT